MILMDFLKQYRNKSGITAKFLSVQLGVCLGTVSNWEQGINIAGKRSLRDLELFLDTNNIDHSGLENRK